MAHKPPTTGKSLSLLSRTARRSSQTGGEPTPDPTPPNPGDIFTPSKSPASGPARERSLPPSRPSSRASVREADTSSPQGGEDIFTPRTHRVAPSNPIPFAPPGFALMEPEFSAIPGKPRFTRILREFIARVKTLSNLPLITREDTETAIQEMADCESFLRAYRLQPKEDTEGMMLVDDEALELYRSHYSKITNEGTTQPPLIPPSTNSVDLLPALHQLLAESRDTKAQLLSLSRRVDSLSAGSVPPRRTKNPNPNQQQPQQLPQPTIPGGASLGTSRTYAQAVIPNPPNSETPLPPVTMTRQETATGPGGQSRVPNTKLDTPDKPRASPKSKRLPVVSSKAKVPTVVITPQAPIAQNNPSYPPATMAALLRTAISQVHNPPQASVTAAYVNRRGNIVVSFAPGISATIVDNLVPLIGKTIMGQIPHQAHRVVKRAALQICRVQRNPYLDGQVPTPEMLRDEILATRNFANVKLATLPRWSATDEQLDGLPVGNVNIVIEETTGKTAERLLNGLKHNPLYLFGCKVDLRAAPIRPPLKQCMNCAALGHLQDKCTARRRCFVCGQEHPTSQHRLRCTACAHEGMPLEAPCIHPAKCVNCGLDHAASDPSCPKKRGFKRPVDQGQSSAEDSE